MAATPVAAHDAGMTSASSFPPPPPSAPPPPSPRPARTLRRSRSERVLGGVAGGVAQTYGVDVALVRIGFVLAAVLGGVGVLVYAIAWLVVPEEDTGDVVVRGLERGEGTRVFPLVLLIVGVALAVGRFDHRGPWIFDFFWPLALIAAGVVLLLARAHREGEPPADAPAAAHDTVEPTADATERVRGAPISGSAPTESAWMQRTPWPTSATRADRPPRPRPFLGPVVFSLLLVFVGGAALAHTSGVLRADPQAVLAIALAGIGAALVVSTWVGRARGLIALGLALLFPLAALSVVDVPFEGGAGERDYRPRTLADLDDEYRLVAGTMTLDLRDIDPRGVTAVEASVAFGELRVLVEHGQPVEIRAEAGAGEVEIAGRRQDGFNPDLDESFSADTGRDVLRLDLRVGFGHVVVERYAPDRGTVQEDAS